MKKRALLKPATVISFFALGLSLSFQNCSKIAVTDVPTAKIQQASTCETDPNDPSCHQKSCLMDGQTVAHGQTIDAYSNRAVQNPTTCLSVKSSRTCRNGVLEGNSSFQYASCTVSSLRSCFIQGHEILHGKSVDAYESQSYPCGSKPVAETRTCHDGTLSGSFPYVGTPTMVGGQVSCPAQTISAPIVNGNGAICVQDLPQSPYGADAPRQYRYAERGPNCSLPASETYYFGTIHYPNTGTRAGEVCMNYCGIVATCSCSGTWEVKYGTW